ncbi:DUF6048 family protein [Croceivirga sp. JEA036]|uniref:DUF6048 family protein n=1 Tax=Croceivirga sp. JEA036 TaxID=2721162 RepID=UPI001438F15D|nr:DUF6048 family protein [Croceivirga sp. JEA036]NJB37542.1 hypothetical protein [Croceivirga sp. JEA036]
MLRYFISLIIFGLFSQLNWAQDKSIDLNPKDTITRKYAYGLRIGVDLSKPVMGVLNEDYNGLEFVADYRLSDKWYIAVEVGNEEKSDDENLNQSILYSYTTKGNYAKAGMDYNTYSNWYGMRNQITVGGRLAHSSFSSTIHNFNYWNLNRTYAPENELIFGSDTPINHEGLNATWLEFVLGLKVELIKNMYLGMSVRMSHLLSNTKPDNFDNLWIPGFNKVTEEAKWGVGYNYSISYFIPLYKKVKKKKPEEENLEN